LQRDYLSIPARTLLGSVKISKLPSPADELFADWDYILARDSSAAALFEIWFSRHLNQMVMEKKLKLEDLSDIGTLHNNRVVQFFTAMSTRDRQRIAEQSLEAAITELRDLLGENHKTWQWASLHSIKFRHPLYDQVSSELQGRIEMPRVSRGGSGDTPNSTRYRRDFSIVSGGSWRMVLDVGNWDNAYMTNTPGQSGNADSPHYSDLLQPWADDESLPLLYSRELIDKHTQAVIKLEPAQPHGARN
jgi:penicillin amidase